MSDIISPVAFQLGVGGIGGFIVGFALKKISKLILIVIGLFLVALIYLSTQGILVVKWDALWDALSSSLGLAGSVYSWLIGAVSLLPFAGSFVVGFLLGFKMG